MITALFIGGPLDGRTLTLDEALLVWALPPIAGDRGVYELRPWGRSHVQYVYRAIR